MRITNETNEQYSRAKQIAECGDFDECCDSLNAEGIFEICLEMTRSNYSNFFEGMKFDPGDIMWKALTVLSLYDQATLEHSLRTFAITKDIATRSLVGPHGENIVLSDYFAEAKISLRDLLLAALGHDIGKTKLPVEILHNSLTNEEMNKVLIDMITQKENVEEIAAKLGFSVSDLNKKTGDEIMERIYERGMRPVNIVPLSEAFPESKYPGLLARLQNNGFNFDLTIKETAKIHEREGQKIFEKLGEPIIADLVGHHHNYAKEKESEIRYTIKIPSLKIGDHEPVFGVYNILKLADGLDSLQSKRPYKNGMSKIAALGEIAHQAMTNRFEKSICYLWISNEYTDLKEVMTKSNINDSTMQDKEAVETIERFLEETKKEFTPI